MTGRKKPHRYQVSISVITFVYSDQQAHCRRCSTVRQQCCCRNCNVIQVSEYLLNKGWVFAESRRLQANTLWACAAQWTFTQIAVGSLLPSMSANAEGRYPGARLHHALNGLGSGVCSAFEAPCLASLVRLPDRAGFNIKTA